MKNLKDVAMFLRNNILTDIPDTFEISTKLKSGASDTDIQKGIKDFRSLLFLLFDTIIENVGSYGAICEIEKTTVSFEKTFPDLIYPMYMLYCIGLRGGLNDVSKCLLIDGDDLNTAFKVIHGRKPNQHLMFLEDLGFVFSGAEITDKSYRLSKAGLIEIQYPDSYYTLIGLKTMADSAALIGKSYKDKNAVAGVFMRCDYHALALPKKFTHQLKDCINNLQDEYKSFLINVHEFLLSKDCKYESKYRMNEFRFTYTSKVTKTVVFSVQISIDRCFIKPSSKLIIEQPSLLSQAPENIVKNVIGYCGHHCDYCSFHKSCGGCRSNLNCCSYATLYPDGKCPNVNCANEKNLSGCYQCDELANCQKGYYENKNEHIAKATALFIREYGEVCYTITLTKAIDSGEKYPNDFDKTGSVTNALNLLKKYL